MVRTSNNNGRRRRAVAVAPYRSSTESLPKIKRRDRRKTIFFEYGNDYDEETGKWTLFVDIISGNSDLVDYVGIKFSTGETHNIRNRIPVTLSDGLPVRRFSLNRSYFPDCKRINITLFGRGGSRQTSGFRAERENVRERTLMFVEWKRIRPYYSDLPDTTFGIELEMSLNGSTTQEEVVRNIIRYADVRAKVCRTYQEGKKKFDGWKLDPDASLQCSRSNPNCNKFELVSPILKGREGLDECEKVLEAVKKELGDISLNKSMGFHVHVDVDDLILEQRKNICMNFVKYENVIDTFMPPSRKNCNDYCKSNRDCIMEDTNGKKHHAIASCQSPLQLYDLLNPDQKRYYKLNLQNLRIGNIPTMEFRQHSCTSNFGKIEAWVRFCMRLVYNSVHRPQSLKLQDNAFELLFDTVIQDIKLKDYYRKRKEAIVEEEKDYDDRFPKNKFEESHGHNHARGEACCDGCEEGNPCESRS